MSVVEDNNASRLERALSLATQTKAVCIGEGVLSRVGELFRAHFPGRKAIIISTRQQYKMCGVQMEHSLAEAGVKVEEPLLFDSQLLSAEFFFVEAIDSVLLRTRAIPIALGAGSVNDLTKLSAYRTGKRYMCVATAASMDGYTAFGASITCRGEKRDWECMAPKVVVADTTIISSAPSHLTASGYGDLFAKVTAGADWMLADALGIEPIKEQCWNIIQESLAESLSCPEAMRAGDTAAVGGLMEGLLLGGFAMQGLRSSRPASGAEHQFSHLWDMEHHTYRGAVPSHGFKVSIGMLASTALYERLLATDFDRFDVDAAVAAWPDAEEQVASVREMFAGTDFMSIALSETMVKHLSKEDLALQLELLKQRWPELRSRLERQIVPFDKVVERLKAVGAPTHPTEIGISLSRLRDSYRRVPFIRRRFTIVDVALRTNLMEQWLDEIFSPHGRWGSRA